MLRELEATPDVSNVGLYMQALAHAAAGEEQPALALLEKLYEYRSPELLALATDPAWSIMRTNKRFQAFLTRTGLTAEALRYAALTNRTRSALISGSAVIPFDPSR